MKVVLLDTSGVIAYLDGRDQHHARAISVLRRLLEARVPLATTSFILSEVLTYAGRLGGPDAAVHVMDFLLALHASDQLELRHLTPNEFMEAYEIFTESPGRTFTFPDATVVWLAGRLDTRRVFGFDRDFTERGLELLD